MSQLLHYSGYYHKRTESNTEKTANECSRLEVTPDTKRLQTTKTNQSLNTKNDIILETTGWLPSQPKPFCYHLPPLLRFVDDHNPFQTFNFLLNDFQSKYVLWNYYRKKNNALVNWRNGPTTEQCARIASRAAHSQRSFDTRWSE